jgi:hypothetical protein
MWAAEKPAVSVSDTASACARGTRDKDVAARLLAALPEMELNNQTLLEAAKAHSLHTLTAQSVLLRAMSDAEMTSIYGLQLGRAGRPASYIRDQLLSAAPYGLCCYCQHSQATTLDHFVPKDHIAALSIDPWNLVPACARCNHKLQSLYGSSASEQFLHPYSMPSIGRWIQATVVPGLPVVLAFSASPAASLSPGLAARIRYEFESLGLGPLFSVVSGPDIAETKAILTAYFPRGNGGDVSAFLLDAAFSAFAANANSRRGALFEALSNDVSYCDGAYLDD